MFVAMREIRRDERGRERSYQKLLHKASPYLGHLKAGLNQQSDILGFLKNYK